MQKFTEAYLKESSIEKFNNKCSKIFLFLCVIFLFFSVVKNLAYSEAVVYGKSMQPTLNKNFSSSDSRTQDKVILNYIKSAHKGDIIVVHKIKDYGDDEVNVIKRLIAVGGDSIEVLPTGQILLNGELLEEDYVNETNRSSLYDNFYDTDGLINTQPELFEDKKLIVPKDHIFYLGDNRGESADCSSYGPVHKKYLIAKVDFIIKSGDNKLKSIIKQLFK